jgi:hypothetical protein
MLLRNACAKSTLMKGPLRYALGTLVFHLMGCFDIVSFHRAYHQSCYNAFLNLRRHIGVRENLKMDLFIKMLVYIYACPCVYVFFVPSHRSHLLMLLIKLDFDVI